MPPPRTVRLSVAFLLIGLAFLLGLLGERWWNGSARDAALRRYERATQEFLGR